MSGPAAAATSLDSTPSGWSSGVLSEYVERPQYGYTDSASDDTSGTKFLRITDIQDGQVNWLTVPYCKCPPDVLDSKRLLAGDVVVARIGATTGKSFYIDSTPGDAVFASYLIRLRTKPRGMLARFLYYYMQSAEYWAHVDSHKGDRLKGGVNIAVLESLPVVVPPLPEQARIVYVLDALQAAVRSEAVRASQTVELQGAVMSELFARGLRCEEQKDTDIGPMPDSWSPRTIRELCDIWSGGTPKKSEAAFWRGDVPWVSGKDLKAASLDDATDHISADAVAAGSRLAPEDAVLLLVRGMGLAKDLPVSIIKRPMAFNQDVKALVSRGELSGSFLRAAIYAGRNRLLSQIARSAHGTMTLNLDDIESFKIACPPDPAEADQVVAILDAIETKAKLHLQKRAVLEALMGSLLSNLLSGDVSADQLDLSALPDSMEQPTDFREASHE
jgi:type I restriction enzyme S subunit